MAQRVHRGDVVPVDGRETVNAYGDRWCDWRKERGLSSAGENRSQLRVHLGPSMGSLPMHEITRERLEDFVRKMDERVRKGEINWKTAMNVWGTVGVMFDDAANCKDRALRALQSNPASGVRPPDKGDITAKQFLYPSEFVKLVECPPVRLLRRRLYAFAVYTYSRAGEIVRSRGTMST